MTVSAEGFLKRKRPRAVSLRPMSKGHPQVVTWVTPLGSTRDGIISASVGDFLLCLRASLFISWCSQPAV